MTGTATETRSIVVEQTLPHPPEKIWRTLTQAELLSRWLMPNDFAPKVGHRFTFKTKPMGDWDGTVHCEVLACDVKFDGAEGWVPRTRLWGLSDGERF